MHFDGKLVSSLYGCWHGWQFGRLHPLLLSLMYGFLLREMLAGLYVAFEVSAGDDTTVTFWELKGDGALFAQLEGSPESRNAEEF